jgi:hypothetical protein
MLNDKPTDFALLFALSNKDLGLPEFSVRKAAKKKVKYKKPQSIKDFELAHQKWTYRDSSIESRLWVYNKFSDNSANDLTKLIIEWLKVNGHFGARINSGATFDRRLGIFRKGSGATAGMADINAVINGKSISIEVKFGKDKIRDSQLKVKAEIEAAGGVFFIAKTFDGFLEIIKQYI